MRATATCHFTEVLLQGHLLNILDCNNALYRIIVIMLCYFYTVTMHIMHYIVLYCAKDQCDKTSVRRIDCFSNGSDWQALCSICIHPADLIKAMQQKNQRQEAGWRKGLS